MNEYIILRNEVYIGKMYQFRKYHIEPKFRLKPLAKNKNLYCPTPQRGMDTCESAFPDSGRNV